MKEISCVVCILIFVNVHHIVGHSLGGNDDFHSTTGSTIPTSKWHLANEVEDKTHWFNSASKSLSAKLKEPHIQRQARNLIMFLGDGMSVSTVTASRIYKGQEDGLKFGEEGQLHMDTFPFVGTSKTYCSDWQVADSACSATAYLCGTKANAMTIGVSPDVLHNNCTTQMNKANHVSSILEWAQNAGMSTGIVTTATVTHASPAGAYAHIANRNWENNKEVEQSGWPSTSCDDIAEQLVYQEPGSKINVILGGGREHLRHTGIPDIENSTETGARTDSKDLVQEWLDLKEQSGFKAKYITGRSELLTTSIVDNDYLLGLFAINSVAYADQQVAANDPSLAEMTDIAIKILSKNPNGFFLFVEGGRIDHAHHSNYGRRAIGETLQFDDAIKLADNSTSDEDTLIVITSDHSHLFNIAGDPLRGNPILGFTGNTDNLDGPLPFTTLGYINGLGYRPAVYNVSTSSCVRANITTDQINEVDYRQVSSVPRNSATHAGENVLIFAKGPWAHLFTGINEQSYIPHGMAFARCINPHGENSCDGYNSNSFASRIQAFHTLIFVIFIINAILFVF